MKDGCESRGVFRDIYKTFDKVWHATLPVNPSRSDPERKEKINLNFYFHSSLWCLKALEVIF